MQVILVTIALILTVTLSVSENKKAVDQTSLAYQTNWAGQYR